MNWLWLPPWGVRAVAATALLLGLLLVVQAWRERRGVALKRRAGPLTLRALVLLALNVGVVAPVGFTVTDQPNFVAVLVPPFRTDNAAVLAVTVPGLEIPNAVVAVTLRDGTRASTFEP